MTPITNNPGNPNNPSNPSNPAQGNNPGTPGYRGTPDASGYTGRPVNPGARNEPGNDEQQRAIDAQRRAPGAAPYYNPPPVATPGATSAAPSTLPMTVEQRAMQHVLTAVKVYRSEHPSQMTREEGAALDAFIADQTGFVHGRDAVRARGLKSGRPIAGIEGGDERGGEPVGYEHGHEHEHDSEYPHFGGRSTGKPGEIAGIA